MKNVMVLMQRKWINYSGQIWRLRYERTWPKEAQLQKRFLINHNYKFIYCPIPKVACSSFKRIVFALEGVKIDSQHLDLVHARAKQYSLRNYPYDTAKKLLHSNEYFRFAIVRNPWDRLISAYLDKFVSCQELIPRFVNEFVRSYYRSCGIKPDINKSITFRQFIEHIKNTDDDLLDVHFKPQYLFLANTKFDFIGRFENMSEDYQKIKERLNLTVELPWSNKVARGASSREMIKSQGFFADSYPEEIRAMKSYPSAQDLFTDDLLEDVRLRYEKDITTFGYECPIY